MVFVVVTVVVSFRGRVFFFRKREEKMFGRQMRRRRSTQAAVAFQKNCRRSLARSFIFFCSLSTLARALPPLSSASFASPPLSLTRTHLIRLHGVVHGGKRTLQQSRGEGETEKKSLSRRKRRKKEAKVASPPPRRGSSHPRPSPRCRRGRDDEGERGSRCSGREREEEWESTLVRARLPQK